MRVDTTVHGLAGQCVCFRMTAWWEAGKSPYLNEAFWHILAKLVSLMLNRSGSVNFNMWSREFHWIAWNGRLARMQTLAMTSQFGTPRAFLNAVVRSWPERFSWWFSTLGQAQCLAYYIIVSSCSIYRSMYVLYIYIYLYRILIYHRLGPILVKSKT